jgi:Xaa-Pro aminopeptidase
MDSKFFTGNRRTLQSALTPNSLLVMTAFGRIQRDVDIPFTYQQESNFWYLTGIEAPEWLLVMDIDNGDEWLVMPKLNRFQLAFEGDANQEAVSRRSGVKQLLSKQEGGELLKKLLASKKQVYTLVPNVQRIYGFQANSAPRKLLNQLRGSKAIDVRPIIAKMRAIKQPAELAALRAAVNVTVDGLIEVVKNLRSYKTENEIDADLYREFRRHGATHAFEPIITSGHKTCVLHAEPSNDRLKDWLLIDVGARVDGYCADIARTIPLRLPTERELQVYEAVERMHDHFLSLLKPGAPVKDTLMKDAYPFIGEQMVKLGLIKRPLLNDQNIFKFMPHAISHGIGVDPHDPLGKPEEFAEGMVLTDEVGTYILKESFGVRIENDIIITKNGAENLAGRLPISLTKLTEMIQ